MSRALAPVALTAWLLCLASCSEAPEPPSDTTPPPTETVPDEATAEPEDQPADPVAPEPHPEVERPGPNVLLLVMDTTRADRCSVHGYERPTTPFLEEFAADAVVFDQAWSPAPWTGPSHASLFTGLRPERHGLRAGVSRHLAAERDTLAEAFQDAGWATAAYSNAPPVSKGYGFDQGFDVFREMFADREWTHPPARRTHAEAATWAEEVHARGEAFFLFVNDFDAHLPYRPVPEFGERFVDPAHDRDEVMAGTAFGFVPALMNNLGVERTTPQQDQILSELYDASIATLDAEIRTLFERLEQGGLLEDTIVVVAGDHGDNVGEHGLHDHQFSVHKGLLHVPLLIRYPGRFEGGLRRDEVVRLEDLHPTILELAALPVPADLDAKSLLRDLPGRVARARLGEPKVLIEHAASMFPHVDYAPFRRSLSSVFDGSHQLIVGSDGSIQLYELATDPSALTDVAERFPDVVERLRALAD